MIIYRMKAMQALFENLKTQKEANHKFYTTVNREESLETKIRRTIDLLSQIPKTNIGL